MAIHSALSAQALETLFSGILITAAKEGECSKASALHPTRTFVNCSFRVTLQGQLTVDLILALNFWLTKSIHNWVNSRVEQDQRASGYICHITAGIVRGKGG